MPAGNLLLVKTSDKEQVGRQDYDQQIARPVREFLEKKDTDERRIKCIVLVYGMPLRVLPPPPTTTENRRLQELQAVLKEKTEREKLAGKEHKGISKEIEDKWADLKKDIRRLSRTDWAASVDSELALVMEKTYDLEGWLPNRYFVDFHGKEIKNIPRRVILVSRVDGPTPAIVAPHYQTTVHMPKRKAFRGRPISTPGGLKSLCRTRKTQSLRPTKSMTWRSIKRPGSSQREQEASPLSSMSDPSSSAPARRLMPPFIVAGTALESMSMPLPGSEGQWDTTLPVPNARP